MTGEDVVLHGATADRPTGLALCPQEGGRHVLTLGGYRDHHPPTSGSEFLEFARPMLPDHIWAAVREAEPLDDIVSTRFTASTRHRYDRMSGFPEGLLVFGDALCSLNPLYGQGMTVAALQAVALRATLATGHDRLARRFFTAAAKPAALAWRLSATNDLALPGVDGVPSRTDRIATRLSSRLLAAARYDPVITEQFLRVGGFLDPPASLAHPRILRRLAQRTGRKD
jgi:2-polyprenyl-6-methoxyphenol hydroxylase-like FAD-dependent oxidoreductase